MGRFVAREASRLLPTQATPRADDTPRAGPPVLCSSAMRRARAGAFALWGALFAIGGACSVSSSKPLGSGDTVIHDVEASTQPPQPDGEDASADSPFARVDSPYGPVPDGYAPFQWCSQCTCPSTSYCFGGGTGHTTFSGVCGKGGGTGLEIGCEPLPAACANEPDCACLIRAVASQMPCYPVCTDTNGFTVYCPNP